MSDGWAILGTMARLPGGFDAASSGCYEASRAAHLSGVPISTLYDWARKGVIVPSISPVQEKLWSYADLMALRLVAWLRRPKSLGPDERLPGNPMTAVRAALRALEEHQIPVWSEDAEEESPIVVDQRGSIFIRVRGQYQDLGGNIALPHEQAFGLLSPFQLGDLRGPDLRKPRPELRIVPARVAGEPHVAHTRITTQTLLAVADRGYSIERVAKMYGISTSAVGDALDLERVLAAA